MPQTSDTRILFLWHFLKRIRHCAGFGIQSPTDYAFVREVIYERHPYYAYDLLRDQFPDASWLDIKVARLIFRVANYAHPHHVYYLGTPTPLIQAHLNAARHNGIIITPSLSASPLDDGDIIITPSTTSPQWHHLESLPHTIRFDLHYLGIAIYRERRYPETHIINLY